MANYVFHIPSRTHPKELTIIQDCIYCFSSNQIFPQFGSYQYFLCVTIVAESEVEVMKKLKDMLITLNIFHYEFPSIRWFSDLNMKSSITTNSIEEIYSENKGDNVPSGLLFDFDKMPIHNPTIRNYSLSFVEVFKKLSALQERNFLYQAISFLTIFHPIKMHTHRIFNNALFENSLQFQLFESIMLQYDTTTVKVNTICPECNREKSRGISKRIDDFFELLDYKIITDKQEVIKAVKKIAKTRNKFLHALAGKSINEYYDDIEPNLGEDATIYLKEDIAYGDGTTIAVWVMEALNKVILLHKLLEVNAKL